MNFSRTKWELCEAISISKTHLNILKHISNWKIKHSGSTDPGGFSLRQLWRHTEVNHLRLGWTKQWHSQANVETPPQSLTLRTEWPLTYDVTRWTPGTAPKCWDLGHKWLTIKVVSSCCLFQTWLINGLSMAIINGLPPFQRRSLPVWLPKSKAKLAAPRCKQPQWRAARRRFWRWLWEWPGALNTRVAAESSWSSRGRIGPWNHVHIYIYIYINNV